MKERNNDETEELEQSTPEVQASDTDRKNFLRGTALTVALAVLVVAILGGVWWFFAYTKDDGLIYPNVSALGAELGGLTPEQAAAVLQDAVDSGLGSQPMTVQLPDRLLTLTPEQAGVQVDVAALVDQAYSYGRTGSRWENTQARAEAALNSHALDTVSCITLNQDAIRQTVADAAAAAASELTQPTAAVTGEMPDLNLTYDAAMAQTDVAHMQLTVTLGTPLRTLNTEALVQAILDAYAANDLTPIVFAYDVTEPQAPDVDAIHAQYTVLPVDAVLDTTNYTVSPEVLGYSFDAEALKTQLAAAGEGAVVTVPFTYLPAAITKASIDSTLFQDVLGSVSTNHTGDSNRNTNLKLACKAINGKLIRPGETFSYNETLGQRTEAKGYKPAGAYSGGKNVETVGGGICQVSSTLYYACLKADLEIVERTAHGFTVSYMPYGMDATVSWGTLDYKFKNNTEYPIRIEAWVSGGQVHVKLIGTDAKDYYVKMTYETVEGPTEGKVVYEDYKWNNPDGYKDGDVIQTAYTGRTVKTYRNKYSKATDELISSTYEATSRYKTRDKIIARVEPQPTEPPETTQPTEPAA